MKSLVLLTLLALLTLGLCRRGTGRGLGLMGKMGVILCSGKGSGGSKGTEKNLLRLGAGGTGMQQGAGYPSADWGGGVSVRDLSSKRSGVKSVPTWSLPEPSMSLAAADDSTSTNDSPSSEGE